jgi:hypothetical protein
MGKALQNLFGTIKLRVLQRTNNIYSHLGGKKYTPVFLSLLSVVLLVSCIEEAKGDEKSAERANNTPEQQTTLAVTTSKFDSTKYKYDWITDYKVENTLVNRIAPPKGYVREKQAKNTYGDWLRHLPLKSGKPKVHTYTGELKYNQEAHHAVIDIDVGKRDLQQCADAVMRFRGEYLFGKKDFTHIHFNYTSGDKIGFDKWSKGYKPQVKGNNVNWVSSSANNASYSSFKKYMQNIFMYAGTASLSRELKTVKLEDIQIGDVFIKGGHPGHAIIVVDVAYNKTTKDKAFLVAQSYMPAQEVHVLKNNIFVGNSPWYTVSSIGSEIITPEWNFDRDQLKRFVD